MNNIAKLKRQAGQTTVGPFIAFPHPDMCEWLAHMGFGAPPRWDEPSYTGAFERLAKAVRATGKAAGTVTNELDRIPWLVEMGHRALLVGEADALVLRGARMALDAGRGRTDG